MPTIAELPGSADTQPSAKSLLDLPLEDCVYPYIEDARCLSALSQASRAANTLSRQDGAIAWMPLVHRRWGKSVKLPTSHSWQPLADWPQPPADWYALARYLETCVRAGICRSVKMAVHELLIGQGVLDNGAWHETVRCALEWAELSEKRRLAAFVCADWQPPRELPAFISRMAVLGETPEMALRSLLLRFPFLPIDAGQGADRVIGCFARAFIAQNPAPLAALGLHAPPAAAPAGDDSSDSDADDASGAVEPTLSGPLSAAHRPARDAVYTLTYSIIMLNTDLHNPAIHPKIQPDEYTASCRRCVPLRGVDEDTLKAIYASIRDSPLQIYHGQPGVATAVRASEDAEDVETAASYSVYSTLPRVPPPSAAGAPPLHGAMLHGGALAAPPPIVVDWSVAYYNIVDAVRYARSASWNRATHAVARLRAAVSAIGPLPLAVVVVAVLLLRARA